MTLKPSDAQATSRRGPTRLGKPQLWKTAALSEPSQPPSRRRLRRRVWIACLLGLVLALIPPAIAHLSPPAAHLPAIALSWLSPSPAAPPAMARSGFLSSPLWGQTLRATLKLASRFGHLPYRKANPAQLMLFTDEAAAFSNGVEYVDRDAGQALHALLKAARADGVPIVLVSGFRDLTTQQQLFQERAIEAGSAEAAAKSVAPPGHSEHHTGYAVDLADGAQDFREFGESPAFEWMTRRAHQFGFELSFPRNNPQGVDYEPWHWRFVGSPAAAKTFGMAASLKEISKE